MSSSSSSSSFSFSVSSLLTRLRLGELPKDAEVKKICEKAKELIAREKNIINISSPLTLCGDLHGQFDDLLELFAVAGEPPATSFLFMGDYVDRGYSSVECFLTLIALKLLFPSRIFLLRGNHESKQITMQYGFYDECRRKFNSVNVWKSCLEVFNVLPISALVDGKIFCVHGGLSPSLSSLSHLSSLNRIGDVPHEGIISDLLWSDPDEETEGFKLSPRGAGFLFGALEARKFLHENGLSFVVRAHQLVMEGHRENFGGDVVTVWSAPNYCYRCGNLASVLELAGEAREFKEFEAAPSGGKKNKNEGAEVREYFL